MTVLDSRSDKPQGRGRPVTPAVLLTDDGVRMPPVEDIGVGRGPSWLDDWVARNGADVLAWYRHLHANPELSRQEFNTTELVAGLLTSVGLRPRLLPAGTGLVCDIGSGDRCVALRADMDALPLTELTGCRTPRPSSVPAMPAGTTRTPPCSSPPVSPWRRLPSCPAGCG